MAGALLAQARIDNRNIISAGGFNDSITFVSRDDSKTSVIQGAATLHHTGINLETGFIDNVRSAHVLVYVQDLVDDGFPVYIGKRLNKVDLVHVGISFVDANQKTHEFRATDVRPSDTFGCVSIMLGVRK
jgi:hypothetical protein